MKRVVSLMVPRAEWLPDTYIDGYHQLSVRHRLRDTFARARAMQLTWLSPYIPQFGREKIGDDRWVTNSVPAGFVVATAVRALRLRFTDTASDAQQCGSVRVLSLSAQWRALDPTVKWADMADMDAWPIAFRVDAKRLQERFAALAIATWCIECDDAPWASGSRRCLWCERIGPPPPELMATALRVAA